MAIVRELLAKLGFEVDRGSINKAEQAVDKLKDTVAKSADSSRGAKFFDGEAFAGATAKAVASVVALSAALKAAAAAASAFVRNVITEVAQMTEKFDKLSLQTGLSSKELQGWFHAANLAGAKGDEVVGVLQSVAAKMEAARTGSAGAVIALGKLGPGVAKSLRRLDKPSEVLEAIAEQVKKMGPGLRTTARLNAALGGSAGNLLPFFLKGRDGLRAMRLEAVELNAAFSAKEREAANNYRDGAARIGLVFQAFKARLAGPVLETLAEVAKKFMAWVKLQKEWQGDVKEGGKAFRRLGDLILKAMKAIFKVSVFIAKWWDAIAIAIGAITVAGVITGILALKAALVAAGIATSAAWGLVFIKFIAIAALIALAALLVEDFIVFLRGGDSLIGHVIKRFGKWIDDFMVGRAGDPWWLAWLRLVARFWTGLAKGARDFVSGTWTILQNFFAWLEARFGLLTKVAKLVGAVGDKLGQIGNKIGEGAGKLSTGIGERINTAFGGQIVPRRETPRASLEAGVGFYDYARNLANLNPAAARQAIINVYGAGPDPEATARAIRQAQGEADVRLAGALGADQ